MNAKISVPLLIVLCHFVGIGTLYAQPEKPKDPLSWDRNVRGLVDRYCSKCHRGEKKKGEVDLAEDVDLRMILQHREKWQAALVALEGSSMPPEDAKQPTEEERGWMVAFLKKTLEEIDCKGELDPGKPILRRLNRTEYDNAIQDLTGLDLKLAEGFAPDATAYGFDHIGEALSLSPAQVEQYHTAATKVVKAIVECKTSQPSVYHNLFGLDPASDEAAIEIAKSSIRRFAERAFRRPVGEDYVARLDSIYLKAKERGHSHEDAMGHLLTAVLISPKFLMRLEQDQQGKEEAYLVDDFELATRLSFFLWSRPPDSILLDLAREGKLKDPQVRQDQVRRMMADDRSIALVHNFFGQWLSLREIQSHQPDAKQFPDFDEPLRDAMRSEVNHFLFDMVRTGRPITDLLDADETYLNPLLAKHYGIEGVTGSEFRKVKLNDRRRGGLLTSAAILMLQADPGRTNVPRRGNYIAGRILGVPPPPPPPGVPPLDIASADGKARSLRETLELHRAKPECANCHAKMDPLGFAFENYDAIGRWRTEDGGFPIDASGTLVTGESFTGPVELKKLLLEKKDAFAAVLIRNLLIYAYGRGLQRSDECVLRECLKECKEHEYRFATIVESIVGSYPFLYRRNAQ